MTKGQGETTASFSSTNNNNNQNKDLLLGVVGGSGSGASSNHDDEEEDTSSTAIITSGGGAEEEDGVIVVNNNNSSDDRRQNSSCSTSSSSSSATTTNGILLLEDENEIEFRNGGEDQRDRFYSAKFLFIFLNDACGSGIGEPSVHHALIVIFLEFFAWGLLTTPMIAVLNETFPDHTFLMNGLIVGIKGVLSFLSAPLIGALSDVWGRKLFLLLTVFFTCAPIPLMQLNTWWYFAMISISGVFAVTFSVVFAYVADVIEGEQERSAAYGLVSATFAASLVTSPALGVYVNKVYGRDTVVALATAIASLDLLFVLVAVPESLPRKVKASTWAPLAWEQADPFAALRKVGKDKTILLLCVAVLLSYMPEAGQYSCFFVYLRLVVGFGQEEVATFIAVVGIMSVVAQTAIMGLLMKNVGPRKTIVIGLVFEMAQLAWYGFGSQAWMMWAAGILAALSSITYPAISAFVSTHSDPDKQGLAQGMITGMRGLCNGLGPAVFGVIFYLFHVDLNADEARLSKVDQLKTDDVHNQTFNMTELMQPPHHALSHIIPGPPFVFGAFTVALAIVVALFIPEKRQSTKVRRQSENDSSDLVENPQHHHHQTPTTLAPLIPQSDDDPASL